MTDKIYRGEAARAILLAGINEVADSVKITLGASGRNVVIQNEFGSPKNTKDGVSVARAIIIQDNAMNQGAIYVKQAAEKTVLLAGDGTTQASILTQAMCKYGDEAIKNYNPVLVKHGIEKAVDFVCEQIKKLSRPIESESELIDIATISANNDAVLGKMIGKAFHAVGKDGEVVHEVNQISSETLVEMVSGMKVNSGLFHYRLANNSAKMTYEAENCYVFVGDSTIRSISDIENVMYPILSEAKQSGKKPAPILFICPIEGDALSIVINNSIHGHINACIIQPPGYGQLRKQLLEDICAFTGAHFHSQDTGDKPTQDFSRLGRVRKVVVNESGTILTEGAGDVSGKIEFLNDRMNSGSLTPEETHNVAVRISRLLGKVAVVKVGGQTEIELGERIDRVDDAIQATRAAYQEGYVAGGGTTYLFAAEDLMSEFFDTPDEEVGAKIVFDSVKIPFCQNLINGGIYKPEELYPKEYGQGMNMITRSKCNLFESKIIDPAKVLRVALQNAASVATSFIITECVITRKPEIQNP
jgi:chaperonin GroEL